MICNSLQGRKWQRPPFAGGLSGQSRHGYLWKDVDSTFEAGAEAKF